MLRFKPRVEEQQISVPLSSDGHMTEEEARAVVALWAERHNAQEAGPAGPRITDVADALDITPEEARGLLDDVRVQQARASQVRRGRRTRNAVVGALILVGAWWVSVFNVNPNAPTLTVEGVQTRMLTPEERRSMGLDIADTRTDVVLKYHPHSLLQYVMGPDFSQPAPGLDYKVTLTDWDGNKYNLFKAVGGSREGVASGWLHAVGSHTYSIGYAYPLAQLPTGGVTLHTTWSADGQTLPINVRVR